MAADRRVLSSLEMLPEECQDDVVWAVARLNERSRTQADILFEFNDRLAVKGQGPISKSAFSRRSTRLKRRRDRLEERDHLYAGIADQITPEKVSSQDVILGELLKTLIDEMIDASTKPKDVMELASAYRQTVSAQLTSARLKAAAKKEAEEEAEKKLVKAVETATGEVERAGHPVDAASVLEIIRKAYRGEA